MRLGAASVKGELWPITRSNTWLTDLVHCRTSTTSTTGGSGGGTNTNGQVNSGTTTSSGGTGSVITTGHTPGSQSGIVGGQSMAGHIAVQPNMGTGVNTNSGTTSAASTNPGGTSATGLRHNQGSGSGRGEQKRSHCSSGFVSV